MTDQQVWRGVEANTGDQIERLEQVRRLTQYALYGQCTCCWDGCDCGCVTDCVQHREGEHGGTDD